MSPKRLRASPPPADPEESLLRAEVDRLRTKVSALEQLLEVSEGIALRKAENLEVTLQSLAEHALALERSERAGVEQTALLQSILAHMSDGLVVADVDGSFLHFNAPAERIIGVGALDVRPAGWSETYGLFLPDGVTPHPAETLPLVRALRGESVDHQVVFVRNPDRPAGLWISVSARPWRDESGALRGGIAVFHDITDAKTAQARLEESAFQLQRSNRDLEDFASVASHDLKEPLRKVQAFGHLLLQEYGEILEEQGRDYVSRMQRAADRMQVLIDDLLSFSRITSDGDHFTPVDLGPLTREVVTDLEARLGQVKGEVTIGALPVIDADPLQIRQLLQNLIGNALKFHRPGVPPSVTVSARVLEQCESSRERADAPALLCELSVEDNGIGFDQRFLDQIFTIFRRLHTGAQYEGTGVGLAICRRIAERHGGSITAQSRPGSGAAFVVTLPMRHARPDDDAPPASANR